MASRLFKWILPALALAGGAVALIAVTTGRLESPVVAPRGEPPRQPVSTGPAGYVGATGVLEAAGENISIGAGVPGLVSRVMVGPGDWVREGQPLFEIDSREARAALRVRTAEAVSAERQIASLAAAVREARADLADRRSQAVRAASADEPGAVSAEEIAQRRFAAQGAQARMDRALAELARQRADAERARSQIAEARTALDRLVVTAPLSAQVLRVNVRPGEYAPAGQSATPLLVLGRTNPLHVRVDVDEADIPRIQSGAPATVRLRGAPAAPIRASFVRVEPLVTAKTQLSGANTERVDTRVLQIVYALAPGDAPVYPGQQVDVFLPAARPATR